MMLLVVFFIDVFLSSLTTVPPLQLVSYSVHMNELIHLIFLSSFSCIEMMWGFILFRIWIFAFAC